MSETVNSAKKGPSGTLGDAIRREYSGGHMDEVQELARQATGLQIWLETGGSLIQAAEDGEWESAARYAEELEPDGWYVVDNRERTYGPFRFSGELQAILESLMLERNPE